MIQATQKYRDLALATPLGEDYLLLTKFSGREEISRMFRYELDTLSHDKAIKPFSASLTGMRKFIGF